LADAARYLAVSDSAVRQMVWRGDLPHIKTGKRIVLDLRDLDGWIEREKVRGV
jgi:excisionase family DNA binding protein